MAISLVIERYSKTLFQFGQQSGHLELLFQEVQSFGQAVQSNQSLTQYIQNPTISSMNKFEFLKKTLGSKISKTLVDFFKLLGLKNRIHLLNQICDSFVSLYKLEILKVKDATVKSTVLLNTQQIQLLKAKIDGIDGYQYEIKNIVEPSIIGGILVVIGNRVIDNTVVGQLQILKKKLLA